MKEFVRLHSQDEALTAFVNTALESAIESSLARLISDYLKACPNLSNRAVFRTLQQLNQGTLDDLSREGFVSYIISHTRLSLNDVASARRSLRTFFAYSNKHGIERMAARGATGTVAPPVSELEAVHSRRIS